MVSNTTKIRLIVFDLDGTLIDSLHHIYETVSDLNRHYGLPIPTKSFLRPFIGPGIENLIASLVSGSDISIADYRARFRDLYREYSKQTHLYPDIKNALNTIVKHSNDEIFLAVLTNKSELSSKNILKFCEINDLFSMVVGPDTYGVYKPDPLGLTTIISEHNCLKDETLFIGDTDIDAETAQSAGVRFISADYGYSKVSESYRQQPFFCGGIASSSLLLANLEAYV